MNTLKFQNYTGSIEYSKEDKLLYGKVLGIRDLVSYEGETGPQLEANFKAAITEYLEECQEMGREPDKPYKGSFNVRVTSALHEAIALKALKSNTSLNSEVSEALKFWVSMEGNETGNIDNRIKMFRALGKSKVAAKSKAKPSEKRSSAKKESSSRSNPRSSVGRRSTVQYKKKEQD